MDELQKIETVTNVSDKVGKNVKGILSWFNLPKEEARSNLVKLIKESDLPEDEITSLIFNSRKLAREYSNSKKIYEQAKQHFKDHSNKKIPDDDWLHFFFDKAQKVSNSDLQQIWSQLLVGEFNQPGSISRKLMHIISIMDANSAISFQTFSYYVFERHKLMFASYDTEAVLIPAGFYIDSFDFMLKTEKWLNDSGYSNYKELALNLTMNTGELNSLENLGLIQKVADSKCEIPLIYRLDKNKAAFLSPKEGFGFPLGQYALTPEGKQLYQIIGGTGNEAVLKIITEYLHSIDINYTVQMFDL